VLVFFWMLLWLNDVVVACLDFVLVLVLDFVLDFEFDLGMCLDWQKKNLYLVHFVMVMISTTDDVFSSSSFSWILFSI